MEDGWRRDGRMVVFLFFCLDRGGLMALHNQNCAWF